MMKRMAGAIMEALAAQGMMFADDASSVPTAALARSTDRSGAVLMAAPSHNASDTRRASPPPAG